MPSSRTISANGLDFFVVEEGQGPLVLLCHGWPELSYSWRHQIPAIAAAGFHVVAPDMRGFGRTGADRALAGRANPPAALFIAGSKDGVITGLIGAKQVKEMERVLPNLRQKLILDGAGHWIQQERPDEVNAALIAFLREVSTARDR